MVLLVGRFFLQLVKHADELGTGKTLLARACAAQTSACYLKLAGPALVQVSLLHDFTYMRCC